jgi:hypothetical protein
LENGNRYEENMTREKFEREKTRLAIGDIHGRTFWKRHLDDDFSEFYILGDYFDSYDISFSQQRRNFIEICEAARQDPRIKLCLGNHDFHYVCDTGDERYSGFQAHNSIAIQKTLEENMDLLKIVYVTDDNYIISHAGLSATFMKKMQSRGVGTIEGINEAFAKNRNILLFDGYEVHGDDITQSPIWIRPKSLCSDPVAGYNQIVGHTPMEGIKEVFLPERNNIKIVFTDTGQPDMIYRF